jgi:exosome complex exonuclease RRP6
MNFQKSLRKQIPHFSYFPLVWVDTVKGLAKACEEIKSCLDSQYPVLAVDFEYHTLERHASILCLIQLSTVNSDYLIDSLVLRKEGIHSVEGETSLKSIFESEKYIKVFHGSDSDI